MATEAVVIAGQMTGQTSKLMGREEVAEAATGRYHSLRPIWINE
jgi:hypothetical protein